MMKSGGITLSIVFDNYLFLDGLKTLWGFSCYIETPKKTILFDTGSNGRVLLENMNKLNKSIKKIDTLFLSHHHWDHIGGVDSLIELNPNVDIIAPDSLSKRYVRDLRSMVRSVTVIGEKETLIGDDLYSTGMMGDDITEQAIVIDSDAGLIIVTGCAHSGIVAIAAKAQAMLNKKIALLVGGFHLVQEEETQILNVIDELKKMKIDYLCPTHCSGERAIELFQETFSERCIKGGLGRVITME
ncbi:MBL fold metallo-hydrolase [Sulfurimonas sp. HSL3-7]|uniref:MBL fold metallo-hydrolase n=1 Tax=Sulfonitrofixus jiaomeiensis TaxID=3131938 RepID=UPI0031FA0A48